MPEYEEEQFDRDTGLVNMMCTIHTALAKYLEDWTQREIRGLISRTQTLATITKDGDLKDELEESMTVIARINEHDLREVFPRLYKKINQVERGNLGEDPLECQQELYEALGGVQHLARQLLKIRKWVDDLWRESLPD